MGTEVGAQFIEGVVVSAVDNSPVAGARLELMVGVLGGAIRATAFSDKDGRFIFQGLQDANSYRITARHPDYADTAERVEILSSSIYSLRLVMSPKGELGASAGPETVPVWALQIPSEARKTCDQGVEELKKKKAAKAIPHLQKAVDLYPGYALAFKLLGTAYSMEGQPEAAIKALKRALEIDPKLPEAAYYLGTILSSEGRDQEALEYLLQAKSLRSDDWRVLFELGQVYLRVDDWALAEQCLRQAASQPRDSPRLYVLLINALALQDKLPEALVAMNDFLDRFPKDKFAEKVRDKRELIKEELQKRSAAVPQEPPNQ
jgi:tetratricopeptide (TPR) repeat protein